MSIEEFNSGTYTEYFVHITNLNTNSPRLYFEKIQKYKLSIVPYYLHSICNNILKLVIQAIKVATKYKAISGAA